MGLIIAACFAVFSIAVSIAVVKSFMLSDTRSELNELRRWCVINGHAKYDVDLDGCTEFKLIEKKPDEPTQPIDMPGPKEIGGT